MKDFELSNLLSLLLFFNSSNKHHHHHLLLLRCLFIFVSIREIYEVSKSSILYPSDVSQSNFEPRTKFPIVMWKYVLPDDQFDMRVNGCVTKMSCKHVHLKI